MALRFLGEKYKKIHLSIENKDPDILSILKNIDVELSTIRHPVSNFTLAHTACASGNLEVLQYLIEVNADLEAVNQFQYTALHLAVSGNFQDIVVQLIKSGVNLDVQEANKYTPLHMACSQCHMNLVEILIIAGANPYLKDQGGMSPFDHLKGSYCGGKWIQQRFEDFSNKSNYFKDNPELLSSDDAETHFVRLLEWCRFDRRPSNFAELAQEFLEGCPELAQTKKTSMFGHSPLLLTIYGGSERLVNRLLFLGADPNSYSGNTKGDTALIASIRQRDSVFFNLLTPKKSEVTDFFIYPNPNLPSRFAPEEIPLSVALRKRDCTMAVALMRIGAVPTQSIYKLAFELGCLKAAKKIATLGFSLIENSIPYFVLFPDFPWDKFFSDANLTLSTLTENNNCVFFHMISRNHQNIEKKLVGYMKENPELIDVKDDQDRKPIEIGSKCLRNEIRNLTLWFGRYQLITSQPEHCSATCFVYFAIDEIELSPCPSPKSSPSILSPIDEIESSVQKRNSGPVRVALKLMKDREQFVKETSIRQENQIDSSAVIPIIDQHEPTTSVSPISEGHSSKSSTPRFFRQNSTPDPPRLFRSISENKTSFANGQFLISNSSLTRIRSHSTSSAASTPSSINNDENLNLNFQSSLLERVTSLYREHSRNLSPEIDEAIVKHDENVPFFDEIRRLGMKKNKAEQFYCIAMPLADRNLFVALKQERFAGRDLPAIISTFTQLVHCLSHLHSKGLIHADLKPLNIVRIDGRWKLIDLDASCKIGIDFVGPKFSTAYSPPESLVKIVNKREGDPNEEIYAVLKTQEEQDLLTLLLHFESNAITTPPSFDLLVAQPTYDVWSLGCLLYQLMHKEVVPLWQVGRDDTLSSSDLFLLEEWSENLKQEKLNAIENPQARNLISRMLMKDPTRRISLDRVLEHPFLTNHQVSRMIGERAIFDVFLSYRVRSDKLISENLYERLTQAGLRVWWDVKCLEPGQNWEDGFCKGLVNSAHFVCLFSHGALENFGFLHEDSRCDNVLLEHRLALELREMELLSSIYPILIGEFDTRTNEFLGFNYQTAFPTCPNIVVREVEEKACHSLSKHGLGTTLQANRTVESIFGEMKKMQGGFLSGPSDKAYEDLVNQIVKLCKGTIPTEEIEVLDNEINQLREKLLLLEGKKAAKLLEKSATTC